MTEETRQGGDTEAGVPQIEITPEMIKAGVSALHTFVAPDDIWADDAEIVESIYRLMASCHPGNCSASLNNASVAS